MQSMDSISQRIDDVIDATLSLRDIRNRLAELDEERSALESKAQRLLEKVAGTAASALRPEAVPANARKLPRGSLTTFVNHFVSPDAGRASLTDRIIQFMAVDSSLEYGATELAAAMGLSGESVVNTIRGTLSRLANENRIRRARYGKYAAIEEGKENGSSVSE
jgi:hypothetical protein